MQDSDRACAHDFSNDLRAACDARLFIVTLAPPEAIASSNRGTRALTDWERQRIAEMYREGYAARAFSDCFVDTSKASADACATEIARRAALPAH